LAVLACAAFVVGTAEFIVVGVLDVVSRDLGVSISVAGYLVMAYALGISIGAPIVMALTTQLERRMLLMGTLALMLAVGSLLLGGQFAAFTYLVPYLQDVTRVPRGLISAFLLIYGAASAVGAFVGGRFADRSASVTLISANVLLVPTLGLLYLFGSHLIVAAFALAAWGIVGFGLVPALQLRVISLAGCGRDLAATLSASAANAGIAAGSLIGGEMLEHHGVSSVVLVAIAVCALALPLTWGAQFLKPLPLVPLKRCA
jgi:DHA1 family inner membrane transport protein